MSSHIGDRMPAPIRFEFGLPSGAGEPAKAVLLGSVDEDGSVRVAVLSTAEVSAPNDKRLTIALAPDSTTCSNLAQRKHVSLWYVLDAAAYTIKGRMKQVASSDDASRAMYEIEVESVWRDFRPDAPMTCGPMYRAPQEG